MIFVRVSRMQIFTNKFTQNKYHEIFQDNMSRIGQTLGQVKFNAHLKRNI